MAIIKKKYVKRGVKKRYLTKYKGKNAYDLGRVIKDVSTIKRKLNVEHKHLDWKFGSGQITVAQYPTKDTPIILPIPLPSRGTAYNNRVGNQIKITHVTSKLQFVFKNNQDLTSRTTVMAQILFARSADDVPDITKLYEQDANGHYTPMSMSNTQEWKKYRWLKAHKHKKSHQDKVNRYGPAGAGSNFVDNSGGATSVITPANTELNLSSYYSNKQSRENIRVSFENGSDTFVTQMKPYLLLRSDVIEGTTDYDPVGVSGIIRFTYVDN